MVVRRWVRWRSWTTSVDFISIKTGLSFGRSIIRSISNPRASIPQRNRGSGVIIGYRASIKQAAVQKEVYKILVERNTFSRPKIEALIAAVGRESAVVACIEHLGPYHLELNMETSSLEECEETLARLLVNHREVLARQTIIRMKREGFNPFRALSMSSNRKIGRDAVLERAFAANEI